MDIHIKYATIPCGGSLTFQQSDNRKSYYKCTKCGDIVKIITNNSYNDMKSSGSLNTQIKENLLGYVKFKKCKMCIALFESINESSKCQKCKNNIMRLSYVKSK
jgi:DNA-directed RNA polymerase subunit RPC12/RpoP